MARFQDVLTLTPVPRSLLDDVVNALLDALEGLPLDNGKFTTGVDSFGDVRLVEGDPLTAGARDQVVSEETKDEGLNLELKVVSWNRTGESQIEVRAASEGHVVNTRLKLRMAGRRLHALHAEGDYQGPGPLRRLQRATWKAEASFEDWWANQGSRNAPPISLRVIHPLAHASFLVGRGKDKDRHWRANGTLRLRGRWIARPPAGVVLLFMRSRIRRMLRAGFVRAETAWNAAVPGMAKRGLQDPVILRHQLEVEPVSREWAEKYAAALHRRVGELRFDDGRLADASADVRLLEGEHIRPGARYRVVPENYVSRPPELTEEEWERFGPRHRKPLEASVAAWNSDGPSRIELSVPEDGRTGWAELDSAQKPALVRAAFTGGTGVFSRLNATGEGDFERWWAGVGGSGDGGPAFTATIKHPLGEGTVSIAGSPTKRNRWKVHVSVAAEGRDWARPLAAVAGLFSGNAIESAINEAASDWNDTVSKATKDDPDLAAKATLHELLNAPATAGEPD